eukprot:TRINITY_DN2988_c0_g1_i1.p1 TRINITY_DN2988_c0_g1~~TRINITY_DN2988_c0_g1_i1.p1  ORF type:complete len:159 (+),score=31.63 TRINITY_DN2988_c0_g1_i1:105-581(+)
MADLLSGEVLNPNPVVHKVQESNKPYVPRAADDLSLYPEDVYDYVRMIQDPEHPYTLEELKVIEEDNITIRQEHGHDIIRIQFTPTVPHCSLAQLIGLCFHVKVMECWPDAKLELVVTPGSHSTEFEINKQINDKERVTAALENEALQKTVRNCLRNT